MPSIKSRRTSPTGDERHSESQSGPRADSVKASQIAAGRSLFARPDVTGPIQTASCNWHSLPVPWQRVTPRSARFGVRLNQACGASASQVSAWLRRPLPPSCAIGWTCQTCGRAVIDARVRHQRRRQPGEHFGLRQPGLQVMDDGAQEP
jgi:hypothetical protein